MAHFKSMYKRELPSPPAIAFSSTEGKKMFAAALSQGTMEGFFPLIEQFHTQDEPAFCGLASIAMVLNTLKIDPRRKWKGSWRWFHEAMLDCCKPLDEVTSDGVTLDQAACIARCNGAEAQLIRYQSTTAEEFREQVRASCSQADEHLVVSYSRKHFLQTGDGHFSPIGGYHADSDFALILDVARFKYCPHWVPVAELYEAMAPKDESTGQSRGYLKLGSQLHPSSVLFTLDFANSDSQEAMDFAKAGPTQDMHADLTALVHAFVFQAPISSIISLVQSRSIQGKCLGTKGECVQPESVEQLLGEIHESDIFQALLRESEGMAEGLTSQLHCLERLAVFLLVAAPQWNHEHGMDQILQAGPYYQVLASEVKYLQQQMLEMPELQQAYKCSRSQCCCSTEASQQS